MGRVGSLAGVIQGPRLGPDDHATSLTRPTWRRSLPVVVRRAGVLHGAHNA
jgi:hypothetical protein